MSSKASDGAKCDNNAKTVVVSAEVPGWNAMRCVLLNRVPCLLNGWIIRASGIVSATLVMGFTCANACVETTDGSLLPKMYV